MTDNNDITRSQSVRLEHVTKIFRDPSSGKEVKAVNSVNFEIHSGELVTLLGPSGCGKTTALRMISGFEIPTEGRILIGGNDVTNLPPNKRDTAMVFQSYGLFPHMNVFDNVAYGLRLRKINEKQIESKVMHFLGLVGLADLAKRPPSRLSGGQQQRVALARSLIVEPAVLLLDEPLSNLDALLREQMRIEIRRLQKSLGITAVYVTHDRVEAMSLSDRIVVMKNGEIAQIGSPSEIYRNPVNPFVAGFVGKVAFFPAIVKGVDKKCAVELQTTLGNDKLFEVPRYSPELKIGDRALVMCRPESLGLADPGTGIEDATVSTNIYLGNSVESWVKRSDGDGSEVLVQIDNPDAKKVYAEGEHVSLTFRPELAKVLLNENI